MQRRIKRNKASHTCEFYDTVTFIYSFLLLRTIHLGKVTMAFYISHFINYLSSATVYRGQYQASAIINFQR